MPRRSGIGLIVCAAASLFLARAQAGEDWNVADTGQPSREVGVEVTEGTWMSVDVSPDGRTLVFDLLGDIYSLPASGGEVTLLHSGPAMQRMPSFSSDGRRLLYMSDASGADNAWISNVDGSQPRQITRETSAILTAATWGPQDDYIAAVRINPTFTGRGTGEIRQYDLDGGTGRVLVETPASERDVGEMAFSPEGRFVYYTERINAPFVYVDANHINYVIRRREIATGKSEQIIGGFGSATTAQLSPDGKRLAFVRRVREKTVLFVYDVESGEQRAVYDKLDRDLHASYEPQASYYPRFDWFPDNRHVAIWSGGKLQRVDMNEGTAQEIPFRARAKHQIVDAVRFGRDLAPETFDVRVVRQLAPSPDGKSLVFAAVGHLWRKSLPEGKPQRITQATAFEFEPAWSFDGKQLAYVEWDDEQGSALKLMPARGGKARTLVKSSGFIREPSFSPDGKLLTYRIQAGDKAMGGFRAKAGIYVVSVSGGAGRFVTTGEEAPKFSADGSRIYYTVNVPAYEKMSRKLQSVTLDGLDVREHAKTLDADTIELRISPDQRWVSFRQFQKYYVVRYRETGAPLTLNASVNAVPLAKLSNVGGHSLTWASDSGSVHWALGASLFRKSVDQLLAGGDAQPYTTLGLTLPVDKPAGKVAFTNARIITMRGDEVIERGTVVVDGNRIAAVGDGSAVTVPTDAKVIDVTGKTLMPGFIDMHGHTECCYGFGVVPQKQPQRYAQLSYGVTTNFDPYSTEFAAYESAETALAGITVSPRWIPSGAVIHGRTAKPDAYYVPIGNYDDARYIAEHKRALGGTFMKSYKQPQRRQRQMLVKAARANQLMVAAEGEGQFYNNLTVVLDGHTTLEHNMPLAHYYDDVVQLMSQGKTANTPTLVVLFGELFGENYLYQTTEAWKDPKARLYVHESPHTNYGPLRVPHSAPPHVRGMTTIHVAPELWEMGFRSTSRALKKLDDAGVIINAGSHGQLAGLSLNWEMWLLAEGGMTNHHVLRAATLNGARTLGLDGQIGSVEAGKLADLIVLDADPLADIHHTNSVRYTMVNGRLYDSLSMNEIGNRQRPRTRFYWELQDKHNIAGGIDWNESWTGQ